MHAVTLKILMKPVLSYIIEDNIGNFLFRYPPNTLLDKITDVWPLIVDYYDNYYPFSIQKSIGGVSVSQGDIYRHLTFDEIKTNSFVRLFSVSYKNKRIKYFAQYRARLCINGYPLLIEGHRIYINKSKYILEKEIIDQTGEESYIPVNNITNLNVHYSESYNTLYLLNKSLLVLSDIIFD